MSPKLPDPGVAAVAVLFVLTPVFGIGGALGMAVLATVVGLACLRPSLLLGSIKKPPLFIALIAALLVWAGISCAWSPYGGAVAQVGKLAVLAVTGLCVAAMASGRAAQMALAGVAASTMVLATLMAIEGASGFVFNRAAQPGIDPLELTRHLSRAGAYLNLAVWPAAAALVILTGRAGGIVALLLIVGAGALSTQFESAANILAFGAGLIAAAAAYAAPRLALMALTGALAAWVLLAPALTPLLTGAVSIEAIPFSWASRVAMWDFTIARIWEAPIWGHGLEASRTVPDMLTVQGQPMNAITNHPHSMSLQIWYELGAIGALIAAAAIGLGGRWLARAYGERRIAAAAACATLAAGGVIANVSFSAWAEWWLASCFIAAAAIGAIGAASAPASRALD